MKLYHVNPMSEIGPRACRSPGGLAPTVSASGMMGKRWLISFSCGHIDDVVLSEIDHFEDRNRRIHGDRVSELGPPRLICTR